MDKQLEVIREFMKANPAAGGLILGGIAVCAAVAMVAAFGVDLNSDTPAILKLLGLGFLVAVLGYVVLHRVLMPIVASCLVVFALAYGVTFAAAQVFPDNPVVVCLASLNCRAAADAKAAEQPGSDQAVAEVASARFSSGSLCASAMGLDPKPSFPFDPKPATPISEAALGFSQQVFVQFAGAITRDAVREFMRQLKTAGWNVQGVEGGGERTASADGLSEVRYAAADEMAAIALVDQLNAWKVIGRTFVAKENSAIVPGKLEIWMGR
ncbi:hypothetical protein [Devosia sp.]|uniref:hypothetical protein n=1 Tax=Devosia sp. TaxID=1871048 RepID=UPI003BABD279